MKTTYMTSGAFGAKSLMMKMMLVVGMMMGMGILANAQEEVYKTLTFSPSQNSSSVNNYTSSWYVTIDPDQWDIENFNNNQNGWNYVRAGRKNNTSVATITTHASYSEAITKVDVTIDAITADKINSIKLYTSSNGSTWTVAGTYTKATGTQSVSLASPTVNLYYKIEFDCASGSSNGLVQVSKVEYYKQATNKYTVTFEPGSGSCETESLQESSIGSGVALPVAYPSSECSSSCTFCGWSTEEITETIYTAPNNIVGIDGETYHPTENITLYAVYKKVIGEDVIKTYNFSEIPEFSSWGNSYNSHIVNYDVANVVFASASQQNADQPITDIPVTKGSDVSVVLRDSYNRIKEVSFVCRQWNDKSQTITLHYSTDGGSTYTDAEISSDEFFIPTSSLNENTNAVKITFSNQNNQVGIESCTIKVAEEAIYTSYPDCTYYNIVWYSNGRAEESVNYENNFPLADGDVPSDPETPSLCGDKVFMGWSETEFEETDELPTLIAREDIVGSIVTSDKTYYAVFATEGTGSDEWQLVTSASNMSAGTYVIGALKSSDPSSDYYIATSTISNDWTVTSSYVTIYNGKLTELPSGSAEFVFTGNNSDGYTVSNGNNYLGFIDVNTSRRLSLSSSYSSIKWTVGNHDDPLNDGGIYLQYNNGSNHYTITENSTGDTPIRGYKGTTKYRAIYLFRKTAGGITYYDYTTFCPCAYEIDGISDNALVWAGKNANADWNSTINWTRYYGGGYHLAENVPTSSNNVYIIKKEGCEITALPHITRDESCSNLTMVNGLNLEIVENHTLTINGAATFTSGIISGNVVFGNSASATGAKPTSHVDGKVTKNGSAEGFSFPTGSNGNLGKVEVTDGTATNVSVQYFSNPAGFGTNDLPRWWNAADMSGENPFNHVSNVEYWKISSTEAITADFVAEASTDMHFNSETAEEDRIPTNIQMAFYDNNRWTNVGGTAYISDNTLSITGVTIPASATRSISGNYTTFGSKSKTTILPIELVSFTAECNGNRVVLEWTTATERNNSYFVVERSDDAVYFTEIARLAGAGNSIEPLSYTYTDYNAHGSDNYYRLVQVDYDGARTASEIVSATCHAADGEPEVLVYPNPFIGDLMLNLENFDGRNATVEIFDMFGRMLAQKNISSTGNSYQMLLNLNDLPATTYNVRVSTADFVINRKVVKN